MPGKSFVLEQVYPEKNKTKQNIFQGRTRPWDPWELKEYQEGDKSEILSE